MQLGKEGWKAESALERTFQVRAISIKASYTKCIIMNVIHINIHHFVVGLMQLMTVRGLPCVT